MNFGTTPEPSRFPVSVGRVLGLAVLVLALTQCATMPRATQTPRLNAHDWTAGDGKRMPYESWPAMTSGGAGAPKAVLLCVHGLSGAASDFWPLGQELPKRGITVYGLQLRGQGNDPDLSARGDIRTARQWQQDVREFAALVRAENPEQPFFWLGESMGSLITTHALAKGPREASAQPDGLLLLSPAIALRDSLPAWKSYAARAASWVAPGQRIPLARLDPKQVPGMRITRDTTHESQAPKTPHLVPAQSLRLLREVGGMMRGSQAAARQLHLPVLVLYTPNDPVVTQAQVEAWFAQLSSADKTRLFFPDDFHLILHDEHRWQAVSQIGDWILERARPSGAGR